MAVIVASTMTDLGVPAVIALGTMLELDFSRRELTAEATLFFDGTGHPSLPGR